MAAFPTSSKKPTELRFGGFSNVFQNTEMVNKWVENEMQRLLANNCDEEEKFVQQMLQMDRVEADTDLSNSPTDDEEAHPSSSDQQHASPHNDHNYAKSYASDESSTVSYCGEELRLHHKFITSKVLTNVLIFENLHDDIKEKEQYLLSMGYDRNKIAEMREVFGVEDGDAMLHYLREYRRLEKEYGNLKEPPEDEIQEYQQEFFYHVVVEQYSESEDEQPSPESEKASNVEEAETESYQVEPDCQYQQGLACNCECKFEEEEDYELEV